MQLTSLSNEKIKQVARLVTSSAERHDRGLFVIEGARLCLDAVLSGISPVEAYYTPQALEKYPNELEKILLLAKTKYEITEQLAEKISDTKSPQGIFTVNEIWNTNDYIIDKRGRYIALDGIQNPDNLGAISRTAEALGYDGLIIGGGCDIYNPKAMRAAMGSLFRLPTFRCNNLAFYLSKCEIGNMIGTVPDKTAEKITEYSSKGGFVLVIGNEGNGISDAVLKICNKKLTIPMRGRAESLNAAAAASICMWELSK